MPAILKKHNDLIDPPKEEDPWIQDATGKLKQATYHESTAAMNPHC